MLNRIGIYYSSSEQNENLERLEATGSYTVGRGILQGLALEDSGSLLLTVHTGVYHILGSSIVIDTPLTYTMPASATNSIWIDENKTLSYTSSSVDSGDLVCLGRVTTTGSAISITDTGRINLLRTDSDNPGVYTLGSDIVFDGVNARVGIGTDSPTHTLEVIGNVNASTSTINGAMTVGTTLGVTGGTTLSSTLAVTGAVTANSTITALGQIPYPTNIETLSADKTLTKSMPNLQILTASGGNRKCILPSSIDWGTYFVVRNIGTSNNILVRNPGDTSTIVTLTPGQSATVTTQPPTGGGSTPEWPSTATAGSPL